MMKRRRFLALGAAAAIAPVLPAPVVEDLTTEALERVLLAYAPPSTTLSYLVAGWQVAREQLSENIYESIGRAR